MCKFLEVDNLENYSDVKHLHEVSPHIIKYALENSFSIGCQQEKIAEGDWDLHLRTFEEANPIYDAYVDVFFNGKSWHETVFYNEGSQAGTSRVAGKKNMSPQELELWKVLRCRYLNYLFKAMREFGYSQDPFTNFVSVCIGRNGEIILNNGRHRLAAAKILNIPIIPILIDVRHRKWVEFRKSILAYAKRHGGKVYAPLRHLDLCNIPSRQEGRADDVLGVISSIGIRTVVDLGAQWGHMCQVLEDAGLTCTAVEKDDVEFSFLEKLKMDYNYDIVHSDICDFIEGKPKFDCVLALSIFHHLAKTEEGHERLLRLLNKLDCKEMIFQMPDAEEMKMFHAYRDYTPAEFTKLIIDNSCLNYCEEIGNRETRKMFHFRKY